jgi:Flp pilus assembly protein CpaB
MQAVTIRNHNQPSSGPQILPGDNVDALIATESEPKDVKLILEELLVLKVDDAEKNPIPGFLFTLAVKPEDAEKLTPPPSLGKIHLLIRASHRDEKLPVRVRWPWCLVRKRLKNKGVRNRYTQPSQIECRCQDFWKQPTPATALQWRRGINSPPEENPHAAPLVRPAA